MKTRGIVNAINRLNGARKFGSATLLAQAENEAQHTLTQAKIWLDRSESSTSGSNRENHEEINRAAQELEKTMALSQQSVPD
jgi:hypothetical protein